jgi:hypothetical protein
MAGFGKRRVRRQWLRLAQSRREASGGTWPNAAWRLSASRPREADIRIRYLHRAGGGDSPVERHGPFLKINQEASDISACSVGISTSHTLSRSIDERIPSCPTCPTIIIGPPCEETSSRVLWGWHCFPAPPLPLPKRRPSRKPRKRHQLGRVRAKNRHHAHGSKDQGSRAGYRFWHLYDLRR